MCQNQNKREDWRKNRATLLAFKNNYSLSVESVIRGHHVYKETWNPYKGEKLICNYDKREEAKIFEDYAVGMIA